MTEHLSEKDSSEVLLEEYLKSIVQKQKPWIVKVFARSDAIFYEDNNRHLCLLINPEIRLSRRDAIASAIMDTILKHPWEGFEIVTIQ